MNNIEHLLVQMKNTVYPVIFVLDPPLTSRSGIYRGQMTPTSYTQYFQKYISILFSYYKLRVSATTRQRSKRTPWIVITYVHEEEQHGDKAS